MGSILVICSLGFSTSHASNTDLLVGGVLGALLTNNNSSNQQSNTTKKTYRSKKRASNIPKNCSTERWTTQSITDKQIATNFNGIIVSYDDMGDIIVKVAVKNTIPAMFKPNDKIQLTAKFSKGSRTTSATLGEESQNLIVSGMDAMYFVSKLKASSYIKINFVNNTYCSRLKGSSNSIKTVESSATFYKNNRPDHINEARVTRATQEHATHSKRVASNQKEFSHKVAGIRPKSDLDEADGNIYETKIQYYKPGSEEIGEMWVDWFIDDEKGPLMRLNFIDPTHQYENKTHVIKISLLPIEKPCNTDLKVKSDANTSPACKMVKDLLRTDKWGKIAKKQEMKRQYTKRVSYVDGDANSKLSLGINFKVYEDGAMSAQIEHIKHSFPNRFNFTLTNALELSRYIENTRAKAQKKWMNKTRSKEDLDALFN